MRVRLEWSGVSSESETPKNSRKLRLSALHSCHNVIRNCEHLDRAAACDEIAKVLFVKVWVERELRRKRQRQKNNRCQPAS